METNARDEEKEEEVNPVVMDGSNSSAKLPECSRQGKPLAMDFDAGTLLLSEAFLGHSSVSLWLLVFR